MWFYSLLMYVWAGMAVASWFTLRKNSFMLKGKQEVLFWIITIWLWPFALLVDLYSRIENLVKKK